jgi:hypothetical protein
MCCKARAAAQALQRGCHVPHGDAYKKITACHSFSGACCFYVRRVGGQATHVYTHTVPAPGHAWSRRHACTWLELGPCRPVDRQAVAYITCLAWWRRAD